MYDSLSQHNFGVKHNFGVRLEWRLVKKLRWRLIRFPEGEVFNSPGLAALRPTLGGDPPKRRRNPEGVPSP
jgi:hypothetical protein